MVDHEDHDNLFAHNRKAMQCKKNTGKKERRRFSPDFKLRILAEADACTEPGQINALLKRERLYSSNLSTWRRERDQGLMAALTPKKRGPKAKPSVARRIAKLEKNNQLLQKQLRLAERTIHAQKKQLKNALSNPEREISQKNKIMTTAMTLSDDVGKKAACEALLVPRASFYRFINQNNSSSPKK